MIQSKKKFKKMRACSVCLFYTLKRKTGAIWVPHTGPENRPLTIMIVHFWRCDIRFKALICEFKTFSPANCFSLFPVFMWVWIKRLQLHIYCTDVRVVFIFSSNFQWKSKIAHFPKCWAFLLTLGLFDLTHNFVVYITLQT